MTGTRTIRVHATHPHGLHVSHPAHLAGHHTHDARALHSAIDACWWALGPKAVACTWWATPDHHTPPEAPT